MFLIPCITLRNGVEMPLLGYGTSHHGGHSHQALVHALKHAHYTHIDTAERYGSERNIGEDIKTSGVPREKLFITTKVWPASYGYSETKKSFRCSLRNLGTDYIDLYLLHWPDVPTRFSDRKKCYAETWRAMEELYESGVCKAIGVSNFLEEHLEELFQVCSVKPHLNQIEFHPYCNQKKLIAFCKKHGVAIGGYSPLGKAIVLRDAKLRAPLEAIALHHNKTLAQVLIRWSVQHGVVTIPKSTKVQRVNENIAVFDFELTDDEMKTLDCLCDVEYLKVTWDPQNLPCYKNVISHKTRDNY